MRIEAGGRFGRVVGAALAVAALSACTNHETPEPKPPETTSSVSADSPTVHCETSITYNGGRNFSISPIVLRDEEAPESTQPQEAFTVNWGDGVVAVMPDGEDGATHEYSEDGTFSTGLTGQVVEGGVLRTLDCGTRQIVAGDAHIAGDGSVIGQPYFDASGQSPHCNLLEVDEDGKDTVVEFANLFRKYGVNISSVSVDWGEYGSGMGGDLSIGDTTMAYPTKDIQPDALVASVNYKNGSSINCTLAR